jgi:hypothetical protein
MRDDGETAYDRICANLDAAIAESMGFSFPEKPASAGYALKLADERALLIEAAELLPDRGEGIRGTLGGERATELEEVSLPFPTPLAPDAAEKLFLESHEEAEALAPQRPPG